MAKSIITPEEAAAKRARSNERVKQWRIDNPDRWKEIAAKTQAKPANKARKKAYDTKWAAANPDRIKATMDKWREANRDVARTATRKWRAENPGVARAAVDRWIANNPEHVKALKANRRTRELEAEGEFTAADIKTLVKRQRGRCAYHDHCGHSIKTGYHVDHIIPLARGGTNWPRNLQLTCANCNNRKHAKHPIDFARELGRLL